MDIITTQCHSPVFYHLVQKFKKFKEKLHKTCNLSLQSYLNKTRGFKSQMKSVEFWRKKGALGISSDALEANSLEGFLFIGGMLETTLGTNYF